MSNDRKSRNSGDIPLGDITAGFGTLIDALGAAISEISERLDKGETGEVRRSFEVDTGKGPIRAEAGVRVRFADQGPRAEPTGGVRAHAPHRSATTGQAQPRSSPPSRPIDVEILEDAGTWRLTADIPGVEKDEVALAISEGELVIETTGRRRFEGRAAVPDGITLDDIGLSLRNGILELTCPSNKASGR